jgi:hypothetical protein
MISARSLAISLFWVVFSVNFISAQELSSYREFQFGSQLPIVARQAGLELSAAKVVHERPALIQELNRYSPISFGSSSQVESVKTTLFTFYNGQLSRLTIGYDPNRTKGLTDEDMVAAISVQYGTPTRPAAEKTVPSAQEYNNNDQVIAVWEDPEYSFTLSRSQYQSTYGVVGVSKQLDTLAQAANVEAIRLDQQEAPARETKRRQKLDDDERASREKARLDNKPNFRP